MNQHNKLNGDQLYEYILTDPNTIIGNCLYTSDSAGVGELVEEYISPTARMEIVSRVIFGGVENITGDDDYERALGALGVEDDEDNYPGWVAYKVGGCSPSGHEQGRGYLLVPPEYAHHEPVTEYIAERKHIIDRYLNKLWAIAEASSGGSGAFGLEDKDKNEELAEQAEELMKDMARELKADTAQ